MRTTYSVDSSVDGHEVGDEEQERRDRVIFT